MDQEPLQPQSGRAEAGEFNLTEAQKRSGRHVRLNLEPRQAQERGRQPGKRRVGGTPIDRGKRVLVAGAESPDLLEDAVHADTTLRMALEPS